MPSPSNRNKGRLARQRARPGLIVFLCALASFSGAALSGETAKAADRYNASPFMDIMIEAVMQNIIAGAGAEIDFTLPGKFFARARASYSFPLLSDSADLSVAELFGMDGLKAQAGFDFIFKASSKERQVFRRMLKVSETYSTETWLGYYYMEPYHASHAVGLDILLESTSAYALGSSQYSLEPTYYRVPAYSVYLYPHYRYTLNTDYWIPNPDSVPTKSRSKLNVNVSVGPLFCPDFSQFGLATDALLIGNLGPVELCFSAMLGFTVKNEVPDGAFVENPEGAEEAPSGIDGAYIPYRLSVGINIPIAFGDKEAGK